MFGFYFRVLLSINVMGMYCIDTGDVGDGRYDLNDLVLFPIYRSIC